MTKMTDRNNLREERIFWTDSVVLDSVDSGPVVRQTIMEVGVCVKVESCPPYGRQEAERKREMEQGSGITLKGMGPVTYFP
jgi:hypothetical protein